MACSGLGRAAGPGGGAGRAPEGALALVHAGAPKVHVDDGRAVGVLQQLAHQHLQRAPARAGRPIRFFLPPHIGRPGDFYGPRRGRAAGARLCPLFIHGVCTPSLTSNSRSTCGAVRVGIARSADPAHVQLSKAARRCRLQQHRRGASMLAQASHSAALARQDRAGGREHGRLRQRRVPALVKPHQVNVSVGHLQAAARPPHIAAVSLVVPGGPPSTHAPPSCMPARPQKPERRARLAK